MTFDTIMKKLFLIGLVAGSFSSCVEEPERKPPGPQSTTSKIPWNSPSLAPGQGGGQLGMLPQNRHRR